MKSNSYPHTHMMTLKEWKQFVRNVERLNNKLTVEIQLITGKEFTFNAFINTAFEWDKSKEGFDYWNKISQRTKPIDNGKE